MKDFVNPDMRTTQERRIKYKVWAYDQSEFSRLVNRLKSLITARKADTQQEQTTQ